MFTFLTFYERESVSSNSVLVDGNRSAVRFPEILTDRKCRERMN